MVMIFAGGHISGAHYNPAVTLAVFISRRSKISLSTALGYLVVQLVGGIVGGFVAYGLTDEPFSPKPGVNSTPGRALVAEILFTFALATVVLNVATTKSQDNNSFFGLAIGFTVLTSAFSIGRVSGACLNPAVGTALIMVMDIFGKGNFEYIWIYWFGPLFGAVLASGFFRICNWKEYSKNTYYTLEPQSVQ